MTTPPTLVKLPSGWERLVGPTLSPNDSGRVLTLIISDLVGWHFADAAKFRPVVAEIQVRRIGWPEEGSPNGGILMTRQLTSGEAALSWMLRHLPIKHGAHRILDRLCPKQWVNGDPVVNLGFSGKRLTLDISDLVGWHFAMLRNFDPEVAEIILKFADNSSEEIFWDIGANKGTLSYQIARKLPKAKIVAQSGNLSTSPVSASHFVARGDAPPAPSVERRSGALCGRNFAGRAMGIYDPLTELKQLS